MGYEVLNLKQEKSLLMTKGIIVENNKAETNLDSSYLPTLYGHHGLSRVTH